MEYLTTALRLVVDEGRDGLRHEIDGNEIEPTEVWHRQWNARWQESQERQSGEEVVRAVDLVHLARPRIADHDRRPVHPPAQSLPLADELLRLVLRAVIRRRKPLPQVEIVLGEGARIVAGDSDR